MGLQPALNEHAHQRLQLVGHPCRLGIDLSSGTAFFGTGIRGSRVGDGQFIPFMEPLVRAEQAGHEEIENAPQFGKSVLDRRAGQSKTMVRRYGLSRFGNFGGVVFDVLSLIQSHDVETPLICGVVVYIPAQQIV